MQKMKVECSVGLWVRNELTPGAKWKRMFAPTASIRNKTLLPEFLQQLKGGGEILRIFMG
jgi:hypothetical protein